MKKQQVNYVKIKSCYINIHENTTWDTGTSIFNRVTVPMRNGMGKWRTKKHFRRIKYFWHSTNMHNRIILLRTLLLRHSSVFQQSRSQIIVARAESQWRKTSACSKCIFLTSVVNSSLVFISVMHCKIWVRNQKTLTLFYQDGVKNWLSPSLTS